MATTPSRADDERFLRWSARLQRATASPWVVHAYLQALLEVDVRPILPLISAPTPRRSKAANLLVRLDERRDQVQRFLDDLRVPFTNNLSEHDIRMVKLQ